MDCAAIRRAQLPPGLAYIFSCRSRALVIIMDLLLVPEEFAHNKGNRAHRIAKSCSAVLNTIAADPRCVFLLSLGLFCRLQATENDVIAQ
jgi:hypothetical protein